MSVGQNTASSEALRSFVERIEYIREQKKSLADDEGAILAQAKAEGYVPAAIRHIVKVRKMKPSDRQENEELVDSYLHALGMATDTPLFRSVGLMSVDVTMKDQVIDAMKKFVPANGSITIEAGGAPLRLTRDKEGNVSLSEVVEKPVQQTMPGTPRAAPRPEVPNVNEAVAEGMGRQAFKDDKPIISNPFPFGDPRRARFDEGWRKESGSDGMGDE
jgi:uncharacterized protein (UPF0335 family)